MLNFGVAGGILRLHLSAFLASLQAGALSVMWSIFFISLIELGYYSASMSIFLPTIWTLFIVLCIMCSRCSADLWRQLLVLKNISTYWLYFFALIYELVFLWWLLCRSYYVVEVSPREFFLLLFCCSWVHCKLTHTATYERRTICYFYFSQIGGVPYFLLAVVRSYLCESSSTSRLCFGSHSCACC